MLAGAGALTVAGDADAFCRTMACPLPAGFSPSEVSCVPQAGDPVLAGAPDFPSYCASLDPPAKPIPVWWRNACVSYDIQQNASAQVPYDTAATMIAQAFAKWTSIECPDPTSGDADAGDAAAPGSARVSIDVRDLGPVACDLVQYSSDHGNQHVIIFHDDAWPHDDANNTLGLTTVTYDPDTGEIYDADMEINATVPLSIGDPVMPGAYDFDSIITHECGHFLGMAHTGDDRATMYASYTQGTTYKRVLTSDDVSGLCSIYLAGGDRAVDPSATPDGSGLVPEDACDPTPRHGFSAQCAPPASKSCSVTGGAGAGAAASPSTWIVLGPVLVLPLRRRRCTPASRTA
ncbi:MAG TPA: matrixin family metalloprotease [Polyangiaceae bacterium]|jgi:hypothetical protein